MILRMHTPSKITVGLFAVFNFENVDDQNVVMD